MTEYLRGLVWRVRLDPLPPARDDTYRPALVISTGAYNQTPADFILVVPIAQGWYDIGLHVPIQAPEGGLAFDGALPCDARRPARRTRLSDYCGTIHHHTLRAVELRLRTLLELSTAGECCEVDCLPTPGNTMHTYESVGDASNHTA